MEKTNNFIKNNVFFFKDKEKFSDFFKSTKTDHFSSNEIYAELVRENSKWFWYRGDSSKCIKLFIPTKASIHLARMLFFLIRQSVQSMNLEIDDCRVKMIDEIVVYNIDRHFRERKECFEIVIQINAIERIDPVSEPFITPNNCYFWDNDQNNKRNVNFYQYGLEGDFSVIVKGLVATFGPCSELKFFLKGFLTHEHGTDTHEIYNNIKEYERMNFKCLDSIKDDEIESKHLKLMDWAEQLGIMKNGKLLE